MASPARETDELLLDAFRRGNTDALGILYDRHARTVLGFALRFTGDRALAEEDERDDEEEERADVHEGHSAGERGVPDAPEVVEHAEREEDVGQRHERDDDLRDVRDTLHAAENNDAEYGRDGEAGDELGNGHRTGEGIDDLVAAESEREVGAAVD